MVQRDKTVGAAVSSEEQQRIQQRADELGLSVSSFVRLVLLGAAEGKIPLEGLFSDD